MEQLPFLPSTPIGPGLVLGAIALLIILALLAWRAPLLFKLGTRNVPRRIGRAALIVCGLTLATAVIGSALSTGDTMDHTIRSLVADSLGPIDEVVVANPPADGVRRSIDELTEPGLGGLAAANLDSFENSRVDRLRQGTVNSAVIAAVVPAIVDQVSVVDVEGRDLQSALALLALPTDYPDALGPLVTAGEDQVLPGPLDPNAVVLNQAAADLLGTGEGQPLQIRSRRREWDVRVAAVVQDGGVGGRQPLLIASLDRYQQVTNLVGRINAILIVNRGDIDTGAQSGSASRELRTLLADREAALRAKDYLARPEAQRALLEQAAEQRGPARGRLEDLRREAGNSELSDQFISLIADPRLRQDLFRVGWQVPGRNRWALYRLMNDLAPLSVVEVKQEAIERANEYGTVVTTVFLVLGICSVTAGLLLIYLIFALLAADRRAELATMRALGMSRSQIVGVFLFESIVFDLLGALLGVLLGMAAAYLTISSLAETLSLFGLRLNWRIDSSSLLFAFCGGLLLTFGTSAFSAWRSSQSRIVAATRGEQDDESRTWLLAVGLGLLAGAALVWQQWHEPEFFYQVRSPLVMPGSLTLLLLGLACLAHGLAGLVSARSEWERGRRAESFADDFATLIGFLVAAVWLRSLAELPTPRGDIVHDAVTIAFGGLVLILAGSWAVTRALAPLLRLIDHLLSAVGRLRAVVRPVAGYLAWQRWRAGLAIVLFGMVIFVMVTALTMIDALLNAYAGAEPAIAGFHLRADQRGAEPILDISQALNQAPAASRDDFQALGSIAGFDVQAVQFGASRSSWRTAGLAVVDDGFLRQVDVRLERLAPGYQSGNAWQALAEHQGTAVIGSEYFANRLLADSPSGLEISLPTVVWIRAGEDGRPVRLQVIGVIDGRSELEGDVYVSRETAAGLGIELPAPTAFLFTVAPGTQLDEAAEGLRVSFAERGLSISDLGERVEIARSVRLLLARLVQGFMGLGLLAGVSALGILGVQSVIERRQQIGTLRALGFSQWQTRATILIESGAIAALGIGLGIGLGLAISHSIVALLAQEYPEVVLDVPWLQIGWTVSTAWVGSAFSVALAVWYIGRVSPAEALRTG